MSTVQDTEMSGIVLSNIVKNESFASKVLPELSVEFFTDATEKAIAQTILNLRASYSTHPTVNEIVATMKETGNVHGLDKNVVKDILGEGIIVENQKWLIDRTEEFIKRRRTMLAFEKTFAAYENGDQVDGFYKAFQDAASFRFDDTLGYCLVDDADGRWEIYNDKEAKTRFHIDMMDKVTCGGMEAGTLNCLLAGTNAGKSLLMGDIAAKSALAGSKVLVISLEMAEIKITERIESNLMNVPISDIRKMDKGEYYLKQQSYVEKIKLSGGVLKQIQYPTRKGHVGHFRNLITEFKNRKGIEFDLIVIDYLNICGSEAAVKNANSYTEVKGIAEELRALAIEFKLPILTATQTNRSGQDSTDLSLDNVSESHGLSATVDLLFAMVATEEWIEQGKMQIKQLKSRYGDKNYYNKFFIGVDRKYMRIFDMPDEANNTIAANRNKKPDFVKQEFDLSSLG